MKLNAALSFLGRFRPFALGLRRGNVFRNEGGVRLRGRLSIVSGSGNLMIIGEGSRFSGRVIIRGSNNKVLIGKKCDFRGDIIINGHGQTISFGDHSTALGIKIQCQEGCDVSIGRWCMLSREIEIFTTDTFSVINRNSYMRTNLPGSVVVGDHVWVGLRSIISRGVTIADDTIVAAGSFVNKPSTQAGVVIAGSPARIVKRGVTWNRSRKAMLTAVELNAWHR